MTAVVIEKLKQQVSAIECHSIAPADNEIVSSGSDQIDRIFPAQGLALGSLLEIQPKSYRQRAAALGVALAHSARLLGEKSGPLIWCQLRDPERLHLHAPGLAAFGINPARIVKLTLKSEKDLLWAMEEALECPYVSGVVGILSAEKIYDFTASKRLVLRAKQSGVSALLLRSHRVNGATAADMRWSVAGEKSSRTSKRRACPPRLGKPQWRLDITKCRGAKPGIWQIGWNRETLCFDLASRLADRATLSKVRPADGLRHAG